MNQKRNVVQPSPQKLPVDKHHKQVLWQVWLPLAVSIIIFLVLGILTILAAANGSYLISKWGSIAAIYEIIPVLFVGLVLMALVGGIIYGLSYLLRHVPGWFGTLHIYVIRIALFARRILDTVTKPIFTVSTASASVEALWNDLFHKTTT